MFSPCRVAVAAIVLVALSGGLRGETPSVLLEKGIFQEETAGNVDKAIEIYRQIVEQEKAGRPIAAQALYRLGECYLKKGDNTRAREAFMELMARFPDQKQIVARTDSKMKSLRQNLSAPEVAALVKHAVTTISTRVEADPAVRKAIESLQGADEQMVVKELVGHLDADNSNMRRSAIYILDEADFDNIDAAIEPLKKLLKHDEEFTRGMAALSLGSNKVESSYQDIADMTLNDKSGYARRAAAYALGLLGMPEGQKVLEKAVTDPDPLVRANAEAALEMLRQATQPAGRADLRAPRVVRTTPPALANDVDPDLKELIVVFDRPMKTDRYAWTIWTASDGDAPEFPKATGDPKYDADRKTNRLPVKLEPGKVYFAGINGPKITTFQSAHEAPAPPYAIVFATRGKDGKPTPIPPRVIQEAKRINAAASPAGNGVRPRAFTKLDLLDQETRDEMKAYERSYSQRFPGYPAYVRADETQRKKMLADWMRSARSGDNEAQYQAIARLASFGSAEAVPVLIAVACGPQKNNRSRWLAVRALGLIGDERAVAPLIQLVDHYNKDTRIYARAALAEITGVYFGTDKAAWQNWLKEHAGKATK